MAWGKVRGLQTGGTEKNYPGYVIRYGQITTNECFSKAYIPLTAKVGISGYVKGSNAGSQYCNYELSANLNGISKIYQYNSVNEWTANSRTTNASSVFIDLINTFGGGNYEFLKGMTSLKVQVSSNTEMWPGTLSCVIVSWLVPGGDVPPDGKVWIFRNGIWNSEFVKTTRNAVTINSTIVVGAAATFNVAIPSKYKGTNFFAKISKTANDGNQGNACCMKSMKGDYYDYTASYIHMVPILAHFNGNVSINGYLGLPITPETTHIHFYGGSWQSDFSIYELWLE